MNASGEEIGPLQEAFKKLAFPDENCRPASSPLVGLPSWTRADYMQQVDCRQICIFGAISSDQGKMIVIMITLDKIDPEDH